MDLNQIISEGISKSNDIGTPAIIYLKKALQYNVDTIQREIKSIYNTVKVLYSVKACCNADIIDFLSKNIDGFSVSSQAEFNNIKKYHKTISATGFHYSDYNLLDNCIFYFNSLSQLKSLLSGKKKREKIKIGLRIEAPNTLYCGKNIFSHFGFTIAQLKELELLQNKFNFAITSILIHQENKVFNDNKKLRDFILNILNMKVLKNVKSINLGGGWDNLFLKNQVSQFINSLKIPNKYEIYIEPGSMLVRTIGILKAEIIDQNIKHGVKYLTLDTSQFNNSSWFVPRVIANTKNSKVRSMKTMLYGNTCYERDFFGDLGKTKLSLKDIVYLYPVGAYYDTTHRELHGIKFPREYFI